jgi:1-deoxy-D-xylulose-5-phosphate synthase
VKGFNNKGNYKITLVSLGNMLKVATQVATQLESEGNDCAIIDALFFKPIDEGTIEYYSRNSDVIVTLEDHVLAGGFGSAILEFLSEKQITVPVVRIGWPDKFIEHASTVNDLRQKYGITSSQTTQLVKEILEQKIEKKAAKELAII